MSVFKVVTDKVSGVLTVRDDCLCKERFSLSVFMSMCLTVTDKGSGTSTVCSWFSANGVCHSASVSCNPLKHGVSAYVHNRP